MVESEIANQGSVAAVMKFPTSWWNGKAQQRTQQVQYFMERAEDHLQGHEYPLALEQLGEAWHACEKSDYTIAWKMGTVYAQAEQHKRAIRILKDCLKLVLDEESKVLEWIEEERQSGLVGEDNENGNSSIEQSMILHYQKLNCYQFIGQQYIVLSRNERALYPLTRCVELMPQNEKYLLERAKVHQSLQMFQEAVIDLTAVLAMNPHQPQALFRRAFAFKAMKKYAEAIADFDHAKKMDPDNQQFNINHRQLHNVNFVKTAVPGKRSNSTIVRTK